MLLLLSCFFGCWGWGWFLLLLLGNEGSGETRREESESVREMGKRGREKREEDKRMGEDYN